MSVGKELGEKITTVLETDSDGANQWPDANHAENS
jgi:hypothetical protein